MRSLKSTAKAEPESRFRMSELRRVGRCDRHASPPKEADLQDAHARKFEPVVNVTLTRSPAPARSSE